MVVDCCVLSSFRCEGVEVNVRRVKDDRTGYFTIHGDGSRAAFRIQGRNIVAIWFRLDEGYITFMC